MAKMFPDVPNKGIESHVVTELFHAFKRQLPDQYLVLSSIAWQLCNPQSGLRDDEIDYLIIDPERGLITIEVITGDRITCNEEQNEWRRDGRIIEDPFKLSYERKSNLLAKFKEVFNGIQFNIVNVVAFPEMRVTARCLKDVPRALWLDSSDILDLKKWVDQTFDYFRLGGDSQPQYLDQEILDQLVTLLSPTQALNLSHANYFLEVNQVIERLTDEQFRVINDLQRSRQLAVSGCAGSGKTIIAVEKALRLDREGFQVLLLCFNPYLAQNLNQRVRGSRIFVADINTFVRHVLNNVHGQFGVTAFINTNPIQPWAKFEGFSHKEINLTLDRLQSLPRKFDAVIVDEGQDFEEGWWQVIEACLTDADQGMLYIFFDDEQRPGKAGFSLRNILNQPPIELSENFRNGGEIFKLIAQFGPQAHGTSVPSSTPGLVKEFIYSTEDKLLRTIRTALTRAEERSSLLRNVVVITAELSNLANSKFDGLVFDTPRLIEKQEPGAINWQPSVFQYMQRYGLTEQQLSPQSLPTRQDIQIVTSMCKRRGRIKPKPGLHWFMDDYGRLSIHDENDKFIQYEEDLLAFFGNERWAETLPRPYKRYRLTSISDPASYPGYHHVKLAGVPSFTGLEAEGIVFIYYGSFSVDDYHLKSMLYTALSRARSSLYLVSPFSLEEKIHQLQSL